MSDRQQQDPRQWLRQQMPQRDGKPYPAAKSTLMALQLFADQDGHCFPSQKSLEEVTGFGLSTIGEALKALEDGGYIRRESRGRKAKTFSSGQFAGTEYWLNFSKAPDTLERNVPQPASLAAAAKGGRPSRTRVKQRLDEQVYRGEIEGRGDVVELLEELQAKGVQVD